MSMNSRVSRLAWHNYWIKYYYIYVFSFLYMYKHLKRMDIIQKFKLKLMYTKFQLSCSYLFYMHKIKRCRGTNFFLHIRVEYRVWFVIPNTQFGIPGGSLIRTFVALFRRSVIPMVRYSEGSFSRKWNRIRYSEGLLIRKWNRVC